MAIDFKLAYLRVSEAPGSTIVEEGCHATEIYRILQEFFRGSEYKDTKRQE